MRIYRHTSSSTLAEHPIRQHRHSTENLLSRAMPTSLQRTRWHFNADNVCRV